MSTEIEKFLKSKIAYLERKRKWYLFLGVVNKFTFRWIRALASIAFFALVPVTMIFPPMMVNMFIAGGVWLVAMMMNELLKKNIGKVVKEEVLPQLFKKVNASFEYDPYGGLSKEKVQRSQIFRTGSVWNTYDYSTSEYLKGEIDKVVIECSRIHFTKKVVDVSKTVYGCFVGVIALFTGNLDHDGDGAIDGDVVANKEKSIFNGLVYQVDFNKSFSGKVQLFPKKLLEVYERPSSKSGMKEVTIDYLFLSEYYKIMSTNDQLAFYILSPSIMAALEDLIRSLKILPAISFDKGEMTMVFPDLKSFFVFSNKVPIKELTYFNVYLQEMQFFEKMVHHFRLEQRIWSKV